MIEKSNDESRTRDQRHRPTNLFSLGIRFMTCLFYCLTLRNEDQDSEPMKNSDEVGISIESGRTITNTRRTITNTRRI